MKGLPLAWVSALLFTAAAAGAQPLAPGRALAATCATCHGTDGHAVDESVVPGLAGKPSGYLVDQMKAFRDGTRPATVMQQIAKGFNDAQVAQLAAYFAAQRR